MKRDKRCRALSVIVISLFIIIYAGITTWASSYFQAKQTSWSGGQSSATVSHSGSAIDQSWGNRYAGKDPYTYVTTQADVASGLITQDLVGKVTMSPQNGTPPIIDTTTANFQLKNKPDGTPENYKNVEVIDIGGGDGTVRLKQAASNPFASGLREWNTLPVMPVPGYLTSYTRMKQMNGRDYVYCTFAAGDGKQFGRYSIADQAWEFLEPLPCPVAAGSAIANDGRYIYVIRGGGSKETYIYLPPEHSNASPYPFPGSPPNAGKWSSFVKLTVGASEGASIVCINGELANQGVLYLLIGGDRPDFVYYSKAKYNTWGGGPSMTDNPSVRQGAGIMYPGGNYLYALAGEGYVSLYKCDINNLGAGWIKVNDIPDDAGSGTTYPWTGSSFCYPGTGAYIYLIAPANCYVRPYYTTNNQRGFLRYGPVGQVGARWERLDDIPATIESSKSFLFDPYAGTPALEGKELWLLSGRNYTRPWIFNTTDVNNANNCHWKTLVEPPLSSGWGGGETLVYVKADAYTPRGENYIYYMPGAYSSSFYRYTVSKNSWEQLRSAPAGNYNTGNRMAYLDGYIYYLPGSNSDTVYRYNINQTPGSDLWDTALQFNPPKYPVYDVVPNDGISNDINWGSGIIAVSVGGKKLLYSIRGSLTQYFYMLDITDPQGLPAQWTQMNNVKCIYNSYTYDAIIKGNWMSYPGRNEGTPGNPQTYIYMATRYNPNGTTAWYSALLKYGPVEDDADSNPSTKGAWSTVSLAPHELNEQGGCSIAYNDTGNSFYSFVGYGHFMGKYSFGDGSWPKIEPSPFWQHYGTYVCGKDADGKDVIFAALQYNTSWLSYNHFMKFDISTGKWTEPLFDRQGTDTGSIVRDGDDNIYLVCGQQYYNHTSHIWVYTPRLKRWTGLIRAPFVMTGGAKAEYVPTNNSIYILEGGYSKKLHRYDLTTRLWYSCWNAPVGCYAGSQMVGDGQGNIFIIGGGGQWYGGDKNIYVYQTGRESFDVNRIATTDPWTASLSVLPNAINSKNGYLENNSECLEFVPMIPGVQPSPRLYLVGSSNASFYSANVNYDTSSTPPAISILGWSSTLANVGDESDSHDGINTIIPSLMQFLYYPGEGDYLYLIPRSEGDALFLRYSISGNKWKRLHTMPSYPTGGVSGIVYPKAYKEDWLYVYNTRWSDHLMRYLYNDTKSVWDLWDETSYCPFTIYEASTMIGYKGYVYVLQGAYSSGSTYYPSVLYRYDTIGDSWEKLADPTYAFSYRGISACIAEYGGKAYIYFTAGVGGSPGDLYRYNISDNTWEQKRALRVDDASVNWQWGNCLAQYGNYIYAFPGSNYKMVKYNIQSDTWTTLSIPQQYPYRGASLLYPGSGSIIYYLPGGKTYSFYSYDVSKEGRGTEWNALWDCPVSVNDSQSYLIYPGFGRYLYYAQASSYHWDDESCVLLRFNLDTPQSPNAWEELTPAPFGIKTPGTLIYPGGEYFFVSRGYNSINFTRYYAFIFGHYVSGPKEVGKHCKWGNITWADNGVPSLDIAVRTGNKSDMSDAADWSKVVNVTKNQDLGLMPADSSIKQTDKYLQYKGSFSTDDPNFVPEFRDITINWKRYPHETSLTSSIYNTTITKNRLGSLKWDIASPLPPGTAARFQLRSSRDGLNWTNWTGPEGTRTTNYIFDSDDFYSYGPGINFIEATHSVTLYKEFEDFAMAKAMVIVNMSSTPTIANDVAVLELTSEETDFWNSVRSDGGDIRFYDAVNNSKVKYYTAYFNYTSRTATIVLQIPEVLQPYSKRFIYMIYSNPNAYTESDDMIRNFSRFNTSSNKPIAWWELNGDYNDTNAYTSRYPLIPKYNPLWLPGQGVGGTNAVYFNGINMYLYANPQYAYGYRGADRTYSMWIKPDSDPDGGYIYSNWWPLNVRVEFGPSGKYRVLVGDGKSINYTFSNSLWTQGAIPSDGKWHNVTWVLKSDKTIKLYIDGKLDTTDSHKISDFSAISSKYIVIGNVEGNDYTYKAYYFKGAVDLITLFDRYFTDEEVKYFYIGANKDLKASFVVDEEAAASPPIPQLAGELYKYKIDITNTYGQDLNNPLAIVNIDPSYYDLWSAGHITNDGRDIRFYDPATNQILNHYVNTFDYANQNAIYYVRIPSLQSDGVKRLEAYYGNAALTESSDRTIFGIPTTNLIGLWKFEENSGNVVKDLSLGGHNGNITVTGTVDWTDGIMGKAVGLRSSSDRIDINQIMPVNTNIPEFTVSAWVYINKFNYSDSSNMETPVISNWNSNSPGSQKGYLISAKATSSDKKLKWVFTVCDGSGTTEAAETAGTDFEAFNSRYSNRWLHLVGVFKGGNYMRLYITNTSDWMERLTQIAQVTTGVPANAVSSSSARTSLGYTGISASTSLAGRIDEVSVYDRALDYNSEIVPLHDATKNIETIRQISPVYKPSAANTMNTGYYYTTKPVIQPIYGVFYNENDTLAGFSQTPMSQPANSEIRYQVSPDGYNWYWWDGATWSLIQGGSSNSNSAEEINAHLATFKNIIDPKGKPATYGDFYWRAYIVSNNGTVTPTLSGVTVDVTSGTTYYTNNLGQTINAIHENCIDDQWAQYKAFLYSDGDYAPILKEVKVQYIEPKITITEPNGGEAWIIDESKDIKWSSQGLEGTLADKSHGVKIEYSIDNGQSWVSPAIAADTPNSGLYSWMVPFTPSTMALMKMTSIDYPVISDISNNAFRIMGLRLVAPLGGEIWEGGSTHDVKWQTYGYPQASGKITLRYSGDNGFTWEIFASGQSGSNTPGEIRKTPWDSLPEIEVDNIFVQAFDDDSAYKYPDKSPKIVDTSDYISIVPRPQITIDGIFTEADELLSPDADGKIKLIAGKNYKIRWHTNSLQFGPNFVIEYSKDDFVNTIPVASVPSGAPDPLTVADGPNQDIFGEYRWVNIPYDIADIKIKVREDAFPPARDTKNIAKTMLENISIIEPFLTLIVPNGGERWVMGDANNITWTMTGNVIGPCRIEYSTDYSDSAPESATWTEEVSGADIASGSYSWRIPALGASELTNCRIRITDLYTNTISDASDSSFTIKPHETVEIVKPNGGEELTMGVPYTIEWRVYGNYASDRANNVMVYIFYSTDGGARYTKISVAGAQLISKRQFDDNNDGVPDYYGGYFEWTPNLANSTSSAKIKLICTDLAQHPYLIDESDGIFSIKDPAFNRIWLDFEGSEVAAPYATGIYKIKWEPFGSISKNIKIEYRLNGGAWQLITAATTISEGTACAKEWTIPDNPGQTLEFRLTDNNRPTVVKVSSAFAIKAPNVIAIDSPQPNEPWVEGETHTVSWRTEGGSHNAIREIKVECISNGITTDIADITDLNALRSEQGEVTNWVVPGLISKNAVIKVYDPTRPATTRSQTFEIALPSIIIDSPNPDSANMEDYSWHIGGGKHITSGLDAKGPPYTIRWHTLGGVQYPLKIYCLPASGAEIFVDEIPTGDPNPTTYSWTVDTEGIVEGPAKIIIKDSHATPIIGTIQRSFSILLPEIKVYGPLSGDKWTITDTKNITWEYIGKIIGPLKVEWSKHGFKADMPVYGIGPEEVAKTLTSLVWTIPEEAASPNVSIRVTDKEWQSLGKSLNCTTIPAFTVFPIPEIYLDKPRSGDICRIGNTYDITWDDNRGAISNFLKLQYYMTEGSWIDITDANGQPVIVPSTPQIYKWKIPPLASTTPSNNVKIRIYDMTPWKMNPESHLDARSPAPFEIALPIINIVYPTEGEYMALKETPVIRWTTDGYISDNLFITLIYSGGQETIETAYENTGSYASDESWLDPLRVLTGPAKIVIVDADSNYGGQNQSVRGESKIFNIIAEPEIEVQTPNGGEDYLIDSSTIPFRWDSKGLSITNVTIEISSDNFNTTYTVIDSTPNDGEFDWYIVPDKMVPAGTNVKARISRVDNDPDYGKVIHDDSNSPFTIRSGFVFNSPKEGDKWAVNEERDITWTTKGNISRINLYYNTDGTDDFKKIPGAQDIPNEGKLTWTVPNERTAQARIMIKDSTDTAGIIQNKSSFFNIIWYAIRFYVIDKDTFDHLRELSVYDDSPDKIWPGWTQWKVSDPVLNSPITHEYPYGTYITTWDTKVNEKTGLSDYFTRSVQFTANYDASIRGVIVEMENRISATIEWHVILGTSYKPETDTLDVQAWLERRGRLIEPKFIDALPADAPDGVPDTYDFRDFKGITIEIYDYNSDVPLYTFTAQLTEDAITGELSGIPDKKGVYRFTWADTGLEPGKTYFLRAAMIYGENTYTSGSSIDISGQKTQYEQTVKLDQLQTTASDIQQRTEIIQGQVTTTNAAIQKAIPDQIQEVRENLEQKASEIITATQETRSMVESKLDETRSMVESKLDETREQLTSTMRSEILNRENSVRSGEKLTIRYRTPAGDAAIDVYDAKNNLRINKVPMVAMPAATSDAGTVYEYTVLFQGGWGKGDFTIVCSDSGGNMDALIISVLRTDIEDVSGQVAAILGATADMRSIRDVAEIMNSQFSIIETALSKVGKDLVAQVKESTAGSLSAMDSVYQQLLGMAENIKQFSGKADISLGKLYDVAVEKRHDLIYLKNKTQQLKAAMEINTKMVENMARKPVTQTWYEYK